MKNRNHGLSEKKMELVQLLMADCESTGDIQAKLKRLFAGTIKEQCTSAGNVVELQKGSLWLYPQMVNYILSGL